MRIPQLLTFFISISLMFSTSIDSTSRAQPAQNQSLVEGNTAFALDLYAQLKSTPGNLFFSPYSISTCLAMTYGGARGDTESQMAKVFHFTADRKQLHAAFGQLQRELNEMSLQGLELNIANGLWAQQGHTFLPSFLETAKND